MQNKLDNITSVYYFQANDEFCMHTNDLIEGMKNLTIQIFSNIPNYDDIIETNDYFQGDMLIVSTSGNTNVKEKYFKRDYYFIDGRDCALLDNWHLLRSNQYFKTNYDKKFCLFLRNKVNLLPSCTDQKSLQYVHIRNQRDIDISFLSGNKLNGRQDILYWLKDFILRYPNYNLITNSILENAKPINKRYSAQYCNIITPSYYKTLSNSYISINAPGGGVNTKKFFEIISCGSLCFNYVNKDYRPKYNNIMNYTPKTNGNILNILPPQIGFPKDSIINFSSKLELFEKLRFYLENKEHIFEKVPKSLQFSKEWTQLEKAKYLLNIIKLNAK
jgi:hypothetical protein